MLLMLKGLFRMLNNRGQSLILFVIVLPVLLLILVLVIDIGRVISLKQELNNISEIVLDYGIDYLNNDMDDNIDSISSIENKLIEIIELNKDDIDEIDVRIDNNKINILLSDSVDGIFSSILDIDMFDIKSSYVGYMDNNKKRIERVNG